MSDAGIQQLLFLLDEAFEGNREHALLNNLRSVGDDEWLWLPPGGTRTVYDIVQHVGECKYVYDDHAFGGGTIRWDRPDSVPTIDRETERNDVVDWLRDGQRRLREHIAALGDDAELERPRRANWGEEYETRWLIGVMIAHDLYHGGEINHIRALHQGNDAWAWAQS